MIPVSLSRLGPAARARALPVAVRADRTMTWAELARDVDALADAVASHGPGRWLLFADDAYAFAVGLLALWQSGSTAVVPPNAQPGTLAELAAGASGTVTDRQIALGGRHPVLRPGDPPPRQPRPWPTLDAWAPRLELFTSGTTGAHKPIPKTLRNLDEEIDGLERQWGGITCGRPVFATVSHHHIYGLLFRLLWPLCTGRPFRAETHAHAGELVPRLLAEERATLVTAPVHLRRLMASEDFRKLGRACGPIFSSGGPLDEATADGVADAFGEGVIEVLGATETGGIAWRRQRPDAQRLAWTPFPKVTACADGGTPRLMVASPFVSGAGPASPFIMEDRVQFLPDGRFLLLGRADRTVKVGERRVSLPEMEERLRAHADVAEAALVLLPGPPEARIGAVIVPSDAGRAGLVAQGRRVLAASLTRHLRPFWDPVLLPRRWLYVNELPRDPQGKVPAAALAALFPAPRNHSTRSPDVLGETRESDSCERTLRVPLRLACLEGHFPLHPIVPGVVQIGWVLDAARSLLGGDVHLASLEALKFKAVLRPGQVFQLRVALERAQDAIQFKLWSGTTVFASGRGRIRAPHGDAG
jgi:acyl-coenzyme A synthetase/AMP-(fatty) acid ligase